MPKQAKPTIPLLEEMMRFVHAFRRDNDDQKEKEDASRALLIAFLSSVSAGLKSSPDGQCCRQLIIALAKTIDPRESYRESLGDLHRMLSTSLDPIHPNYGKIGNFLNLDCADASNLIGQALFRFKDCDRMFLSSHITPTKTQQLLADESTEGPIRCPVFIWKAKEYRFSVNQWALLRALWCREDGLDDEAVLRAVYGEKDRDANALHGLQSRTSKKIKEYKLPFKIWRPSSLLLKLEMRSL